MYIQFMIKYLLKNGIKNYFQITKQIQKYVRILNDNHQIFRSYGNHIKKLHIHNISFIFNDISNTRYFVRNVFSRQQLKAFSPLTQLCLRCYRQKIRRIVLIVSAKKVYYDILLIFRALLQGDESLINPPWLIGSENDFRIAWTKKS